MLPTGFHDVTALMEVTPPTWMRVLGAAGEESRLHGTELTHQSLWHSLTTVAPGRELIDALDVIVELGTESGRDLLHQAANDQQVSLGTSDDEPVRELAARVWVESRTSTPLAEVLVRARLNSHDTGQARVYREFIGSGAPSGRPLGRPALLAAVADWCVRNQMSEAIEVYLYQDDGESRCEVLRGDPVKRVVEIRNGRPSILDFRPAAADHLRYDPETGRLGIATRSPRLLQMYREVLGALLADDTEFFSGENICSLRPLQEHGRELFERHSVPGILHVDVVELRWRRGDRDKVWVRGRDCFKLLRDLGARLLEGEIVEAKLVITFAGGGRRGHVTLKAPNRIDIKAGANERLVERLLSESGIRGDFDGHGQRLDVWSLYPWRMPEAAWRRQVGADFDRLLRQATLRRTTLEAVSHPDHPAAVATLVVAAVDVATVVGASEDPAVGLRTLTSSDLNGYELDIGCAVREISATLQLDGSSGELASGLWLLGRRVFAPTATVAVFLASRQPSEHARSAINDAGKGAQVVLLVPTACTCQLEFPQIECRFPTGPYDGLVGNIVEKLDLQGHVLPPVWLREDLILDRNRERAWFRHVELTKLAGASHPFLFAVKVAIAAGSVVKKEDLNATLSPGSHDDSVAKKAKSDFAAAVKASFKAAGVEVPADAAEIFSSRSGGYALQVSARVL